MRVLHVAAAHDCGIILNKLGADGQVYGGVVMGIGQALSEGTQLDADGPVLGVNLGRLGFLADLQPAEFRTTFAHVLRGEYHVTRHLMYECVVDDGQTSKTLLGLNEVVFHTVPPFGIIDFAMALDGESVAHFSGDGLIVSTPIGATGHNLSAGGPILGQELQAFVITPICPHALTYRPVVESADRVFSVTLGRGAEHAMAIIDGQETVPLSAHHRVSIRRAPVTFGLVKPPGRNFYQTLHDKLRWGTPPTEVGEP